MPQRFGVTYNPLQTLLATGARVIGQGVPNILFRKAGLDLGLGIFEPQEYGVDAVKDYFKGAGHTFRAPIEDTFTKNEPNEDGGFLSNLANAFGITGNVDKISTGDKVTLQPIVKAGSIETGPTVVKSNTTSATINPQTSTAAQIQAGQGEALTHNPNASQDGMPFYFKDLRDNAYIFFRAFIEGLTENISPSYAIHNYIGRSEPVYIYERAEREISMTLKLVAQTKGELNQIYKKMERLTALCYPEYVQLDDPDTTDIVEGYGKSRMKPPLTRFRYGEMYGKTNKEVLGYIKSLSYSVDTTATYEVNSATGRVPKHVIATIGYQVIHNEAPSLGMKQKFYGINQ